MQVDVIQSSKGLNKIKKQRKGKFDLCLSWDTHLLLPSDKGTLGSREAWRLSVLDWIILLFFLDFQFADGRSWDFLVSIVTCINSYNKFPLLSIFPIGILSGECRLIHHAPSCHIIQGNWKPMQQLCRIVWPLMTDRVQGVPDPQLSYVSFSNNKPHPDFHMKVFYFFDWRMLRELKCVNIRETLRTVLSTVNT